ncbi:MAG TPA: dTDP-4-dehydrorhamnose 3,5-epimerase [Fulvivirga sp.]|nr:dTDP-4-dehydrorhamnose 3,5-epimerase [Fulvivirga sp.]
MKKVETGFEGLYILEPNVFEDDRGFFMESYNKKELKSLGIDYAFIQDNHSSSSYGVIRGLHFQNPPFAQTKLIRVLFGKILDIVVDIRKSSPNYGKAFSIELSSENKKQLLVPKGFAHGFATLSETAEILYKCDCYYNKAAEGGLIFNDPTLNINWGIGENNVIVSEKDKLLSPFEGFKSDFE